ncbi:LLM class flavin-dependent oxidoreductase [Kocuria sediminis]|uniref:LLM class flavin-dependent oxidoreductase n=1 Tax=Kocuria sediminis TaxID=1038857 RepID=A0A6N8GQV5_9MICC|nr:LLM class flavin-dependent oxidoreductase [Kocuria sediminis]MUN63214.1 LLM class flavin-dependent oxidoreductase [Kocuria sediminis]
MTLQLGLNTFGDLYPGPDGQMLSGAQVIRNVVAEAALADRVGLDFFGIGEHHREDFAVSSPETVLAGIATVTERIRLGSAVTVLSSDDPVRVYQRFATVDALSSGRAEVILGRGSFTESFPLFGYPLDQYEALFEEKLQLFDRLRTEGVIDWEGRLRAPVRGLEVHPKTESGSLPTWIAVGGSPQSVVRAAHYGLPVIFAIIGGSPAAFAPFADYYRQALEHFGKEAQPVAFHSPGYVAETDEQAREEFFPHQAYTHARIGRERGWGPLTRAEFDAMCGPEGAYFVGSPETVARKIVRSSAALGAARFDLKYAVGTLDHARMTRSIELFGTEVRRYVEDMTADLPAGLPD